MAYQGNQIDYNNLNDELKLKIDKAEGVESQVQALTSKVDNSWQKGVYNNTDITNLSNINASRVFYIYDWKAPVNNIERVSIVIPIENFNGTVKVSVVGNYNNTDAFGAFEYVTSYAKIGETLYNHQRTITKADSRTATEYYFPDFNFNASVFTIPIIRKPNAINNLTVKVELLTTQGGTFEILKNATIAYEDLGTSWNGYPWTSQTSNIPTEAHINTWNNTNNSLFARFADTCVIISDWNGLSRNGMYMSNENTPNAPVNNWCMGMHIAHNDLWATQKVISFAGDGDNREYERRKQGGVWGAWVETSPMKLFTSVSDGKTKVASAISDKGVYTSPIETFDNMAKNIRLIQTGRKNARGSGTLQRVGQHLRIVATGLSFKPSIILVSRTGIQETNTMWKSMYADGNAFMPITTSINMYTYYNSRDTSYNTVHGALAYISNSGFEMNIASYVQGVDETGTYSWIAFE